MQPFQVARCHLDDESPKSGWNRVWVRVVQPFQVARRHLDDESPKSGWNRVWVRVVQPFQVARRHLDDESPKSGWNRVWVRVVQPFQVARCHLDDESPKSGWNRAWVCVSCNRPQNTRTLSWIIIKRTYYIIICLLQYLHPRSVTAHNHGRVDDLIEVAKIKAGFKATARLGYVRPGNVLADGLQAASDDGKDRMKLESCRRVIRRHQRGIVPPDPPTTRDLVIDIEWSTTGGPTPQTFLIHDRGRFSNQRIVMYATEEGLRLLARSGTWYMDGTFSTAPDCFRQLYVIRRKSE